MEHAILGGTMVSLKVIAIVKNALCVCVQELKSLVRQIRESYTAVLRCSQPCRLHLVGLEGGGPVDEALKEHFPGYGTKNFVVSKAAMMLLLSAKTMVTVGNRGCLYSEVYRRLCYILYSQIAPFIPSIILLVQRVRLLGPVPD